MNPIQYRPRRSLPIPILKMSGVNLKIYGVFSDPAKAIQFPGASHLSSCIGELCNVPTDECDHGVGFLILHLAEDGDYLLLSHWVDANMLRHQVFQCKVTEQGVTSIRSLANDGIIACVWELEIMKFERDAWVRAVLIAGVINAATQASYLESNFRGWI